MIKDISPIIYIFGHGIIHVEIKTHESIFFIKNVISNTIWKGGDKMMIFDYAKILFRHKYIKQVVHFGALRERYKITQQGAWDHNYYNFSTHFNYFISLIKSVCR